VAPDQQLLAALLEARLFLEAQRNQASQLAQGHCLR
jgi:hypothetical protein